MIEIRDNGTPSALTYGSMFLDGIATRISTTVALKLSWMEFEWNAGDARFYCIRSGTQLITFPSTGLVAYWKFDESSGNASDITGLGNTLTNNGIATFVA